ncbi:unnamed protein product [Porites evermanni]|uniref:Uncharacterized protein n=1 Tax=Porites evermanni TaxID=104178 RepID=A0ABN8LFV4_9CNID|nr:unnamed protein product [Porites evermanni]
MVHHINPFKVRLAAVRKRGDFGGTSLERQTSFLHCEHCTMHGVTFRMPRWASLRDFDELLPFAGL